ncbi:MAG: LacI family DNA-binding transcriptional regulator [Cypionkella sp.]
MDKPVGPAANEIATGVKDAPNIGDVAELAGVSRAVASRALSSEKRPVSEEKRQRVIQAAKQLGYRPNFFAQSLNRRSVNIVAVLVNHVHELSDLELLDNLLRAVQGLQKQVLLIATGPEQQLNDFLRAGIAYHVDAIVVFSDFADAATVRTMFRSDFAIMVNGRHDGLSPAVVPDDTTGIAAAVEDAYLKGVRRVGLVTGRATSLVEQQRVAAYHAAFASQGIELWKQVQGDYSYESGLKAGEEFLRPDHPGAVFCTSDDMAMGVLDACRDLFPNNRPTRFRLYGFDNVVQANYKAYPIASIGYDKREFVRLIAGLIKDPGEFQPGQPPLSLPTRFVPRDTAQ